MTSKLAFPTNILDLSFTEQLRNVVREEVRNALRDDAFRSAAAEEVFLTAQEVSDLYQISLYSLSRWRSEGIGPRYHRLGRNVRYKRSDIAAWLENNRK